VRIHTPEPVKGRTICIGDLHGCYDEAVALLDKLAVTNDDRVIFVGDLVDRGPKPRECVDLVRENGYLCVLGNHEERTLQQRHSPDEKLKPTHLYTRRALEGHHYRWFETLPLAIVLPEYNAIVVHAGMYPNIPLQGQQNRHLLHIQHINPGNDPLNTKKSYWPSKAPPECSFWTNFWTGPERVIFGHTVTDRPLVTEFAVGIDTGACFGGNLTAVVLPSWEIVSVPGTDHSNGRKTEAKYVVHGDVRTYS
jgi:hypothetical protein